MKLSVILVNYNVKYFLEQCLDSLLASHTPFDYEITIIDNCSTDHSLEYLQPRYTQPHIHFIANPQNTGFAQANNLAIQQAQGEYILLLNPDTVVGENVLNNALTFMDKTPQAGAVGVKMINGSGKFLPESKRGYPTPWASFCKISGLEALFPQSKKLGQYSLKYLDENSVHQIPVLAGAFMLIRHSVLKQTGPFDESFFMYGEDIDLSVRINQAGYKTYYLPETIIHYKGESAVQNPKIHLDSFYAAMSIFFKKHHQGRSRIYSCIVLAGIQFKKLTARQHSKKQVAKHLQTITFRTDEYRYEDIIRQMEKSQSKEKNFLIYNTRKGITIGTRFFKKRNTHAS